MLGMQLSSRLNIETLHVIFWPSVSLEKIHEDKLVKIYWADAALVVLHMVRKMMNQPVSFYSAKFFERLYYVIR